MLQRKNDISQAAECVQDWKRQRKFVHAAPSSATYGWTRTG